MFLKCMSSIRDMKKRGSYDYHGKDIKQEKGESIAERGNSVETERTHKTE